MKKTLLVILWLLLSLILPACKTVTYDEIEAEAKRTGDTTQLDKYEREIERAEAHFINKAACAEANLAWSCPGGLAAKERKHVPDTRQIIRDYRREKWARCGCVTQAQLREIIRDLQRQLSRQ